LEDAKVDSNDWQQSLSKFSTFLTLSIVYGMKQYHIFVIFMNIIVNLLHKNLINLFKALFSYSEIPNT